MSRRSKIWVWCELVCHTCAGTSAGTHVTGALPRRLLIDEARRAGWIFRHDENFCSQNCLEHYERKQREEAAPCTSE